MAGRAVYFLVAMGVLSGCGRDSIQTYRVAKESIGPAPEDLRAPPSGHSGMAWTVPAGWTEQPASAMRFASFQIKGARGAPGDLSVIPLRGEAGGELANINRWRGQINLPPLEEAALNKESQILSVNNQRVRLVDFLSRELLVEDRYKKRILAAILHHGDQTWFFKMTGDEDTVGSAKPAFLQFLRSVRFHAHG